MKKVLTILLTLFFIGCEEFVGGNISVSIDDSSFDHLEIIICEKIDNGYIKANVMRINGTSQIIYNQPYNLINEDSVYEIKTSYNLNNGSYENKIEKIPLDTPIQFEFTINANDIETNCSLKYNGKEYLLAEYSDFDNKFLWYDTAKKQYEAYLKARQEFNSSKYN